MTLKAEWHGAPFTVTSITGVQNEELSERLDFDGTILDLVDQTVEQESNTFSQEFRLTSTPGGVATFGDQFEWLVGAYYYKDDAERSDDYPAGADTIISFLATGGVPPFIRSPNLYQVDLDTESFALFGQGTVDLTDRLSLTLGLRYTEDQKDFIYDASSPTSGLPPIVADFVINDGDTFKSTDPRITLDYQVTDDVLIYGTYSQGFKSGGVQYANAVPSLASQIFQPETLKSYEAGVKSRLFDGRVQANAAAFFYDYEDQQILNIITVGGIPTGFTENAGSSELTGFDLDVQAALTSDLTAVFSYGYLDSEFTSFNSISGTDLTGNQLPRAPEHTIKAGLNYVHPLGDLGDLVLDGHYSWTDEYFFDAENTPYAVQDSFSVVDLSASVEFHNGLTARVFCSNCGDEDIFTNFTVFSDGSGAIAALDYRQRYGVELKKTF
ncbi:MAG: TonB-dependent receptor [Pseudomonadota bacterium]|nr:TonB-dependent receptor [Pseudomonadota bacterium]